MSYVREYLSSLNKLMMSRHKTCDDEIDKTFVVLYQ